MLEAGALGPLLADNLNSVAGTLGHASALCGEHLSLEAAAAWHCPLDVLGPALTLGAACQIAATGASLQNQSILSGCFLPPQDMWAVQKHVPPIPRLLFSEKEKALGLALQGGSWHRCGAWITLFWSAGALGSDWPRSELVGVGRFSVLSRHSTCIFYCALSKFVFFKKKFYCFY